MTPHSDDVTILYLDYDVIIFYDVNPLGYCDVTVSLCPCCRTPNVLLLASNGFFRVRQSGQRPASAERF